MYSKEIELLYAICLNCEQFYVIIVILTQGIHLTKSYDGKGGEGQYAVCKGTKFGCFTIGSK